MSENVNDGVDMSELTDEDRDDFNRLEKAREQLRPYFDSEPTDEDRMQLRLDVLNVYMRNQMPLAAMDVIGTLILRFILNKYMPRLNETAGWLITPENFDFEDAVRDGRIAHKTVRLPIAAGDINYIQCTNKESLDALADLVKSVLHAVVVSERRIVTGSARMVLVYPSDGDNREMSPVTRAYPTVAIELLLERPKVKYEETDEPKQANNQ